MNLIGRLLAESCSRASDLSRRMLAAGYALVTVPSIVSIAGGQIPDPERYKYVHDYRNE